jgi:gliding motility-associated lipoprotein GldH
MITRCCLSLTAGLLFCLFLGAGCKPPNLNAFEKNVSIPGGSWDYRYTPSVTFTISDTNSLYQVFVVCRHKDAYAYKNLWLYISFLKPGEAKAQKDRFELTLQDNMGRWYGTGMDDIWEQRIPLFENERLKAGTYTVSFEQNMRDNPLKGLLDIGLRVEKSS